MRRRVKLSVVASTSHDGLLSIRLSGEEHSRSATDVRRALATAGFRAGDAAVLVPAAYLESLEVLERRVQVGPGRFPTHDEILTRIAEARK